MTRRGLFPNIALPNFIDRPKTLFHTEPTRISAMPGIADRHCDIAYRKVEASGEQCRHVRVRIFSFGNKMPSASLRTWNHLRPTAVSSCVGY
jgi:hypothetical protein